MSTFKFFQLIKCLLDKNLNKAENDYYQLPLFNEEFKIFDKKKLKKL